MCDSAAEQPSGAHVCIAFQTSSRLIAFAPSVNVCLVFGAFARQGIVEAIRTAAAFTLRARVKAEAIRIKRVACSKATNSHYHPDPTPIQVYPRIVITHRHSKFCLP